MNKKTALVTGGTSGIGYQIARLLAKDGCSLIIVARDETELQTTAEGLKKEYGAHVETISTDLFEPQAAEELYNNIKSRGITVDILVNDAAQGQFGPFLEYELQRDIDMIQLNITSLTVLTKLFLKDMTARGSGRVLQLASVASKMPGPLLAVYSATKAYVYSLTQSLINELKDSGVTMTALLPGPTDTDFFHKAEGEDTVVYQDGKLADPEDVARDGYKALMNGESKIVSGLKNKMQVAMANVTPDEALAENMRKQDEKKAG